MYDLSGRGLIPPNELRSLIGAMVSANGWLPLSQDIVRLLYTLRRGPHFYKSRWRILLKKSLGCLDWTVGLASNVRHRVDHC